MIRIAIDLWPGGDKSRSRQLSEIRIANVSNLSDISNYEFAIARNSRGKKPRKLPVVRGKIEGFPRNQKNVLDLLHLVLQQSQGNPNDSKSKKPTTIDGKSGKVTKK